MGIEKIEKNEASWTHTRRERRKALEHVLDKVRALVEQIGVEDRLVGVLFIGIELVQDGGGIVPRAHEVGIAYGEPGIRMLVERADEVLARVAGNIQAGQQARRESVVGGRKLQ